jgi:hypothetical protein
MQFECCKLVEGEWHRLICAFQDRVSVVELIAGTPVLLLLYCGACARRPVSSLGNSNEKRLASSVDVGSRDIHSTMICVFELALRSRLTAANRNSAIQRLNKIKGRAYRDNDDKIAEISRKPRCRWRRRVWHLEDGNVDASSASAVPDCGSAGRLSVEPTDTHLHGNDSQTLPEMFGTHLSIPCSRRLPRCTDL